MNLGNAALQAERIGPAVLAYRRALLIDPDDRRALQNLEHVRALLPEWVPRAESGSLLDSFFFWHRSLSRAADLALAPVAFPAPLPGGVEVRILERRSPWLRIRLANGRDAWVSEAPSVRCLFQR